MERHLMGWRKSALMLLLVLAVALSPVNVLAEALDLIVLENINQEAEEEIQLIELEMEAVPTEAPIAEIELVMLPEREEEGQNETQISDAPEPEVQVLDIERMEEIEIAPLPAALELTITPLSRYGVAEAQPIIADVAVTGGVEPVLLTAAVSLEGVTLHTEGIPAGMYSYLPSQGGLYTVLITAQDAAWNTASDQITVPVSAGEIEPGALTAWKSRVPTFSGQQNFAEKLLAVAFSQIGYQESNDYFMIDNQDIRHGYTIYGDWFGQPYAPWSAFFINFCLDQAGIPQHAVPHAASSAAMMDRLGAYFVRRGSYKPQPGDLVFFADAASGSAARVGIVSRIDDAGFTAIVGDQHRAVTSQTYHLGDPAIVGYMKMEAVMADHDPQYIQTVAIEDLPSLEMVALEPDAPVLLEIAELPDTPIVLQAPLADSNCKVMVRIDADSGIPRDVQLAVREIQDPAYYDRCLESARNALDRERLEAFYLLSISLISGGVDYAGQGGYEVEMVMNDAVVGSAAQAMSFAEEHPVRLPTSAEINSDEIIDRITFQPR